MTKKQSNQMPPPGAKRPKAPPAPPLYTHRDREGLGQHYMNHVLHMTREGLHSKADIAAELAHRDKVIEELVDSIKDKQCRSCCGRIGTTDVCVGCDTYELLSKVENNV